jgi:hypothetical protein
LVPGRRVVAEIGTGAQRQRVGHRHQAGWAAQIGDQNRGIGLIALTRLDDFVGRDGETATSGIVEQAAKQRLGVKARKAQPRDAAVEADQRGRRAVTDQPHILEREITVASAHRAKRRISVKHGRPARAR